MPPQPSDAPFVHTKSTHTAYEVVFNSLDQQAHLSKETLLYEPNDDSLEQRRTLQNAVKTATDQLMLSELLLTTAKKSAEVGTAESKK